MMLHRASAILLIQLGAIPVAYSQHEINGVASPGNTIHVERDVDLSSGRQTINITSAIPVTIQQYNDAGESYLEGQQPVTPEVAKILVTSNCDTSETNIVPVVEISPDGNITVTLQGASDEEDAGMSFLKPSSYSAMWTWVYGLCNYEPPTTPGSLFASTDCETGPSADPDNACETDGEFCQLTMEVCNDNSGSYNGVCEAIPEMCIDIYSPVCGCDGNDYTSECDAHSAGVSVSRKGMCSENLPNAIVAPPATTVASLFDDATQCEAGPAADPDNGCETDGEFCQLAMEVCNDNSGSYNGVCASLPLFCATVYSPVCGCDGNDYTSECDAHSAGVSVSRMGMCSENLPSATIVAPPATTVASLDDDGTQCEAGPAADPDNGCETDGEFCQLETGACNDSSGSYNGVCASLPLFCATVYSPVCGCDGNDYSNVCDAHSAGVSVSRMGMCSENLPNAIVAPPATTVASLVVDDGTQCSGENPCLTPEGECATIVQCVADPCGEGLNPCGEDERCISNYCGGCNAMCIPPPILTIESIPTTTTSAATESSMSSTTTTGATEELLCEPGQTCTEAGSFCTQGTETCCGKTYPSFKCDCVDNGEGQLEYDFCLYTDSCYVPPCCIPGPPADKPPPAEGMCETGELCDTGIEDDYCCYDSQGGTGSYCSISGGKASETTSTTATAVTTTTPLIEEIEATTPTNSPTASPQSPTPNPTRSPIKEATTTEATAASSTSTAASSEGTTTPAATTNSPTASQQSPTPNPTGSPIKEATTTEATAASSTSTAASSEGTTTPAATTGNPTGSPIEEVVTTAATTVSSSTEASADSTTTSSTKFATIDGDFPTGAPSTKMNGTKSPTTSPSTWWSTDGDRATELSSAFHRSHSFSFYVATTLMVIVAISVIFPSNGGGNHFWGFGKFAVAAVAVASLYPKSSIKNGNIRKINQGRKSSFHSQNERALQTCSFNVEVLLDACTKSVEINAPSGRVIEVSIDNSISQQREDGTCTTDYEATLNFPVTDDMVVLNLTENNTFAAFEPYDFRCLRAVIGRPFVDATGGSLQAMPWVSGGEVESTVLSWTGDALMETRASHMGNATNHGRFLMGEDWTQRALGEHASVASFSAFSIALMTNQAPSDLVNDALKAGLDEVRHAKVSFDIASRLSGKEVGPGPLPPSSHEFGHDLRALALAVAREGCVDETLSAFAAAMEVERINEVLEMGVHDALYSNIGHDMLTSIRDELVTIAMDESNHSALAWRTLGWVCDVDSNACDSVNTDVFEESNLEKRFKQRADNSFSEKSAVLSSMRGEWMKIFNAHRLAHSGLDEKPITDSFCMKADSADDSGQPLLTSMTENVLRQVLCS